MRKWKETICMVVVLFCLNLSAIAQTVTLKLTNVTVKEAMSQLKEKSGYTFFYNVDDINQNKRINVDATNLTDAINQILKDQNVEYEIKESQVLVRKINKEPARSTVNQKVIKGNVKDKTGEGLVGVSVLVKGTSTGAITDINGDFSVSAKTGDILEISYIGYRTLSVTVKDNSPLNILLEDDTQLLDEVVVVGYGVQKKSSLTGAVSSVKNEDIQNRTITRAEEALGGKTAGVQLITTSSQPGASPTIRVRGFSSNGSSDPLYIIDGLIATDLSAIDPNNIQSMEVLKDAASAAIYGAQAGNGVILITTKTGSKGKANIRYDFQYSLQSLAKRPKLINAQEAIQQNKEADSSFTEERVQELINNGVWDGKFSTDWYDVAFTSSPMTHHMVSFEGGNEKGNFFLSLSNLYNNGIIRENRDIFKRLSVMINADYNILSWMKVGITANFNKTTSKQISDGSSNSSYSSMISRVMTLAPYFADTYAPEALPSQMQALLATGYNLLKDDQGNYYSTLGSGESMHPMVAIKNSNPKNYGNSLNGTLYANFLPFKGMTVTSRLGYNIQNANTYTYRNLFYGSSSVSNKDRNGATRTNTSITYYQWENFFNYSKSLMDVHHFTLMGGMSYSENNLTYISAGVDKVAKDDPLFQDVSYPSGDAVKSALGYNNIFRKLSYFGRLSYDYNSKYMFQVAFRADAADLSVLPSSNRWGYFPSFSAGWVLSNEKFFQKINRTPITFAKLRVSWGQNGSTSNLTGYRYSNALTTNAAGYSFYNSKPIYVTTASPSQLYNPDLKWETSEQIDLGLDLRAFNDRLIFGMDWFSKKTKDLIISNIVLPYEAGNRAAPMNAGSVRNRGFEFELSWRDRIGKDFSYSISANLATLKNKVTYLDPNVANGRIEGSTTMASNGSFSAFEVGYPVWYFRGYQVDHLDDNGAPIFRDNNDDSVIDGNDKAMIGKPMADFTYGITLNLNYKNFDLTAFGSGSQGNDIFMSLSYNSISYSLKKMFDQRWTKDGLTSRKYAAPSLINADKYSLSDAYIFNGSYFRIKQIQLGYTFPKNLIKKAYMENCRVYASLDDFFTITKYPGLDPEVSATSTSGMGIDYGNYPTTKKLVLGLSVTF